MITTFPCNSAMMDPSHIFPSKGTTSCIICQHSPLTTAPSVSPYVCLFVSVSVCLPQTHRLFLRNTDL